MKEDNKIEVKDTIKTSEFKGIERNPEQYAMIGREYIAEEISDNGVFANGYWWPLSSLTLVSKAPESDLSVREDLRFEVLKGTLTVIEFSNTSELDKFLEIAGGEYLSVVRNINSRVEQIFPVFIYCNGTFWDAYRADVEVCYDIIPASQFIAVNSHESDKGEVEPIEHRKEYEDGKTILDTTTITIIKTTFIDKDGHKSGRIDRKIDLDSPKNSLELIGLLDFVKQEIYEEARIKTFPPLPNHP